MAHRRREGDDVGGRRLASSADHCPSHEVANSAVHAGTALRPGAVRDAIVDRLERSLGKSLAGATRRDIYDALDHRRSRRARRALDRDRHSRGKRARVKRVCYLSMEFLLGRSLINALSSFEDGLIEEVRETLESLGHDLDGIAAEEEDPGLGNGGLGRLAACFLDSLATLGYAATGYGIRYDYGIFTQVIGEDGAQREVASSWLGLHNFWESGHGGVRYRVRFGGHCQATRDEQGRVRYEWVDTHDVWAVGYDLLIPGNRSPDRQSPATVVGPRDHAVSRSRRSTPATTPRRSPSRSTRRISRACCIRTTRRRRARSCASSSSTSSSAHRSRTCSRSISRERRAAQGSVAGDRDPAQRHASGADDRRADAPAGRRLRHGVGEGVEASRARSAATRITRCCRKRSRPGRCRSSSASCRAICRSSIRSTATSSKR